MKPFDGVEQTDHNVLLEVITGHSHETVTIILLLHTGTDHCTPTKAAEQFGAVAQNYRAIGQKRSKTRNIFEEAETA